MAFISGGGSATAVSFDQSVINLAVGESRVTGLSTATILDQWYTEEGTNALHYATWSKFGNNPAGMRPGDSSVDAMSNGLTSGGFDAFPSPEIGAQAYGLFMEQNNYRDVRTAARTGQFTANGQTYNGDMAQIMALAASPWDGGHYSEANGQLGSSLIQNYDSITGAQISASGTGTPSSGSGGNTTPLVGKNVVQTLQNWDNLLTLKNLSIKSIWDGSAMADAKALALRAVFLILGILLIAFAIRIFVGSNLTSMAGSIADNIAPME